MSVVANGRAGSRLSNLIISVALSVLALGPAAWLISVSLKTQTEYLESPFGLPNGLRTESYRTILADSSFLTYAKNSLVVTVSSVVIILVLSTMGAYALARFDFRGQKGLFVAYLLGNAIPIFLILLPLFVLLARTGLGGKTIALILAYAATSMGISVLILRSYFRSIPSDMEDAARIDGCGTWALLRHIMAPLIRPGLIVVAIYNTINIWNEYFLAAFLLPSQEQFTLPPGLAASFASEYSTNWPGMAAGIVLSAIPLMVIFVVAHDKIVEGFSMSPR